MLMKSTMYTKASLLIGISSLAVLFSLFGCSGSKVQNGLLPKNFTWAYGSWDIKQDIPNGYPEEYKAFIGNDYVQLMPASTVEDCICPYIEAMPQKDYRVSVGEPVDYSNTHEDMTNLQLRLYERAPW